jgi:hypothetical protein
MASAAATKEGEPKTNSQPLEERDRPLNYGGTRPPSASLADLAKQRKAAQTKPIVNHDGCEHCLAAWNHCKSDPWVVRFVECRDALMSKAKPILDHFTKLDIRFVPGQMVSDGGWSDGDWSLRIWVFCKSNDSRLISTPPPKLSAADMQSRVQFVYD